MGSVTLHLRARRGRLVARHHLGRTGSSATQAVSDLVALHSSDPLTPHLALWARVPDYQSGQLDAAQSEAGGLWRLHAMRRTLWVAAAGEVGMMYAAAGEAVAARERARLLGWIEPVRPDAVDWLASLERRVVEAIRAQPGVSTRALSKALPELTTRIEVGSGKWKTQTAVGPRVLYQLAMELTLMRTPPAGSWRSSQYGWAVAGAVDRVDADAARATLVRRYLQRFGPVTTEDVKWWTGLTMAQTKRALRACETVTVALAGGDAWDLQGTGSDDPTGVALLPGLDPTPMGYKVRGWFLGDHEAALFDRNGNVGPTVWVEGRIAGGWAVRAGGSVRVKLLEDVGAEASAAVTRRAAELEAWLDGTSITPRFRTPLERELTAS